MQRAALLSRHCRRRCRDIAIRNPITNKWGGDYRQFEPDIPLQVTLFSVVLLYDHRSLPISNFFPLVELFHTLASALTFSIPFPFSRPRRRTVLPLTDSSSHSLRPEQEKT